MPWGSCSIHCTVFHCKQGQEGRIATWCNDTNHSWFYAMMRVLRHKDTLKSTIHTLMFRDSVKNDKIRGAVMDIENEVFFKALYILLRAVFPANCALHFTDSNEPMMDKI